MKTIGTKWGFRAVGGVFAVLGIVAGCSSTTTEGTNTNWVTCHEDADCTDAAPGAICVEEHCVSGGGEHDGGSGGKASGGASGAGGRAASGGAPSQGAGGGGLIDIEGGACTRAPLSEPCQAGRFDCLVDFRKERYKYLPCASFDGAFVEDCGGYDGLVFRGIDTADTLFFRKSDGRLAGVSHTGMTSGPPCEWYEEGFTVPTCTLPPECPADAGGGRALTGRAYDAQHDCYGPSIELAGIQIRETASGTSGLKEIACLKAADGTLYAIWKGYTEALVFPWDTQAPPAWSVYGEIGLNELDIAMDSECQTVVTRGEFDRGGGLGTGELITGPDGSAPPSDGGVTYAGECR